MKVKWTTITEDESTWPPANSFVVVNYGRGSLGAYRYKNSNNEWVMVVLGDGDIKLKDKSIVIQWRPMPKPPKKKKHWTEKAEEAFKCESCGSKNGIRGILSVIDNKCSECRESKSPWKPKSEMPKNEKIVIRCKQSSGMYDYGVVVVSDNGRIYTPDDFEWMEIPE